MSSPLAFRLSRGVINTITPPATTTPASSTNVQFFRIPTAKKWGMMYVPTAARPLLDMSQGAPGIPPPNFLRNAIGEASSSPSSYGYTADDGEISLRKALTEEMKITYGSKADLEVEDVALTAGCNLAFVATIMSIADAGDEVILPVPWYFNHQMDLTLLGIKPVPLPTYPADGFAPSVEKCSTLITSRTKAIALVTPNNPTGAIYSPSLIASFATVAKEHNVALVLDETYRDFIMTGAPHDLFNSRWRATLVHLFSFSKSYCVPGHRLGAIVASPTLLKQIKTVLDCLQICPPRPLQIALAPLMESMRPFIRDTALAIESRHALFRQVLPKRWKIGSQGGYYAFVRHPFVNVSSLDVSKRLAVELGVVTLPSTFFCDEKALGFGGWDGGRWIRFSVANVDDEKVRKVCERLEESERVFGWALDS